MIGLALATVISPIVFISMFLMLGTVHPIRNGWFFLLGLICAVAVTTLIAAFVLNKTVQAASDTTQQTISWFGLAMGFFELGLGLWLKFKGQPPGQVEMPKFATKLDTMKVPMVFAIGILVPTFPAAVSAGVILVNTNAGDGQRALAEAIYLLVCAVMVGAPLIYVQVRGEPARDRVRGMCDWLVQRSSTVGAWILIVVGIYLILQALPPLV